MFLFQQVGEAIGGITVAGVCAGPQLVYPAVFDQQAG